MNYSILETIKKMLGIDPEQTAFDIDIIAMINAAFMSLSQLGVGSSRTFSIESKEEEWDEFVNDIALFEAVKTYIYLKVRVVFDPPSSSAVMEAFNKNLSELEFRLNVQANEKKRAALEDDAE